MNYGDFLGAYGLVGIVVTLLLRSDRVHRIVLWLWGVSAGYLLVLAAMVIAGMMGGAGPDAAPTSKHIESIAATSYIESVTDRLTEWPGTPRRLWDSCLSCGSACGRRGTRSWKMPSPTAAPTLSNRTCAGWLHADESMTASISTLYADLGTARRAERDRLDGSRAAST